MDRGLEVFCSEEFEQAQPLVSVLMPTYNQAGFIEEAIRGVVEQCTDFTFELLIGDDSSTDETFSIARAHAKRFPHLIKVLRWAKNVGAESNYNELVRQVRGRFVAYCEGDDYWTDSNKLQMQVDFLQSNPKAGLVHTNFAHIISRFGHWRIAENDNNLASNAFDSENAVSQLLVGNFIQSCTFCARVGLFAEYRKSALNRVVSPVGDWPFFIFVASASEIGYLDCVTAVYRRAPGSATNAGYAARMSQIRRSRQMIEQIGQLLGRNEEARIGARDLARLELSWALFTHNKGAFSDAWNWLEAHDREYTRHLKPRIMAVLIHSRLAGFGCVLLREFKMLMSEMRNYQRMD